MKLKTESKSGNVSFEEVSSIILYTDKLYYGDEGTYINLSALNKITLDGDIIYHDEEHKQKEYKEMLNAIESFKVQKNENNTR